MIQTWKTEEKDKNFRKYAKCLKIPWWKTQEKDKNITKQAKRLKIRFKYISGYPLIDPDYETSKGKNSKHTHQYTLNLVLSQNMI